MKVINQLCRYLTLALGICSVVLFFFPFLSASVGANVLNISGAQLAFGATVEGGGDLYVSSYYLLTFLLTAFATVMAGIRAFTKKGKGAMITSFISALIGGIVMLVIALSRVTAYADLRPMQITGAASLSYAPIVLIAAIVILAFGIVGVIAWLVNDYLEVLASKGQKLTIWKKIKKFFTEMIAEIKKIIWPGPKDVVKNSVIVLILCAVLGAFIWIVDYLLGLVVDLVTKL